MWYANEIRGERMPNLREKLTDWIENRWGSKYFRKSFLLILFITSIPGIISAIGIYTFGLHSTEDELRKIHVDEINESKY